MVTRKPVAPPVDTAQAASSQNNAPPYPTTPTKDDEPKTASSVYSGDLNTSPAFDLIDIKEANAKKRRDSDVSSHGTWDSDDTERDDENDDFVEVPKPLKITPSKPNMQDEEGGKGKELPSILRPGPANGAIGVGTKNENQQYDEEAQANPWQLESNNPYNKQNGLVNHEGQKSNAAIWEQAAHPPPPSQAPPPPPVELPAVRSPTEELGHLSLNGPLATPSYTNAEVLPVPQQGQPPLAPVASHSTGGSPLPSTNPWADIGGQQPPPPPKEALSPAESSHAPQIPPIPQLQPQPEHQPPSGPPPSHDLDHHYQPPPGPPPGYAGAAGPLIDHAEPSSSQHPPPIRTQAAAAASTDSVPETPRTKDRRQRSEHYQIKHVNWSENGKMRTSPILTQNANGPCPLLALVNALVLSTPVSMDTALVETLRTREQVSLGLLLDAVFDELMSGRRGETATQLPDVGELYAFLLALHTGMNVNPRFITPVQTPRGSYDGHPAAMNGMHPLDRAQSKPGSFEETNEMRLYSTFNIPLIHGWTAPKDTPAYAAFQRTAQTYEDAQNIQFAEAELEDKLRTEGLSFQEQQTLEDIQTIKSFLQTWPTQLTDHGLEAIAQSVQPGQIAILFRNDHFSTLYKEPKHGALMTLVTDTGYSSHAEIVWESLVDVNGAASEYFSGDFRSVSHGQDAVLNQNSSGGGNEGWQTVQRRNQRPQSSNEAPPPLPGPRPNSVNTSQVQNDAGPAPPQSATEQEDADLALALQLQEEEEDQQRQAEARRRREQELSERFLSTEGNERPPAIPPRRNQRSPRGSSTNIPVTSNPNRTNGPQARPAVNRPADSSDPDAPPSYEQSASDRPYRPAGATAPPTQGNPLNTLDALRRQQSAYAQQSTTSVNTMQSHNRRASQGNRIQRRSSQIPQGIPGPAGAAPAYPGGPGRVQGAPTIKDADDRCVVM